MEVEKTNQEDLTPKSLLEKLKSEDIKQKTFAVKNSQILFTTIGPDRSRKELIPYLISKSKRMIIFLQSLIRLH